MDSVRLREEALQSQRRAAVKHMEKAEAELDAALEPLPEQTTSATHHRGIIESTGRPGSEASEEENFL